MGAVVLTAGAGMWLIRNTQWSRDFLTTWYTLGEYDVQRLSPTATRSGDQDTLKRIVSAQPSHFKIMPQCSFNSYPFMVQWEGVYMKGDFNLHLAGKGNADDRVRLFHGFQDGHIYSAKPPH